MNPEALSAEQKRALLAELLRKRAQQSDPTSRATMVHPLSHNQRAMWFLQQYEPESTAYNTALTLRIRSQVDVNRLEKAFQSLIDRHAILRTTYTERSGEPFQITHVSRPVNFTHHYQANPDLQSHVNEPFDLAHDDVIRAHLFTNTPTDHILLIVIHHIACDAWSYALMLDELRRLYGQEDLATLPNSYNDFVRWQDEFLISPAGQTQATYWHDLLGQTPSPLDLPTTTQPRPGTYQPANQTFTIGKQLTHQLQDLARAEGTTLFVVLLSAYQLLLARYSQTESFLVGTPVSGRSQAEFRQIIGDFINMLALPADLSQNPTVGEHIQAVHQTVLSALANQDYPYAHLVEHIAPNRAPGRDPLIQAVLNFQQPQRLGDITKLLTEGSGQLDLGGLLVEACELDQQEGQFALNLGLTVLDNQIQGKLRYNAERFEAGAMARLTEHFVQLLRGFVSRPGTPIFTLPLLTPTETDQILNQWNNTQHPYPHDKQIHQLVTAQATRSPHKAALIFQNQAYTYTQLNEEADSFAEELAQAGVQPGQLVAIHQQRTPALLISLLAIFKCGAAYLPLDPSFPTSRLIFMLNDAQPEFLITDSQAWVAGTKQWVVDGDRGLRIGDQLTLIPLKTQSPATSHQPPTTNHQPPATAYLIYTSGSTGQPKGIPITHQSVVNFLISMQKKPGIASTDRLLAITTYSFDISILELFLPLVVGATVVLASRAVASDGERLAKLLEDSHITVMQATPSTWQLLITSGWQGNETLRKILCGGEALSQQLAEQLLATGAELWNLYGPAETTIWSTVARLRPGDSVNIGHPIHNTQALILDKHHQPVPIGHPGILHLGGDGLTAGYHKRPQLTAERFRNYELGRMNDEKDAPFIIHNSSFIPSNSSFILYNTGDLARYRPDGTIEFIGRNDQQVKLRGYRIELGDIESALLRHPSINHAVVLLHGTSPVDKKLVAYIVAMPETSDTNDIQQHLKLLLPPYMLPAEYVFVEQLIFTPNNKIDRKAIAEFYKPELANLGAKASKATDLENLVASIWASVLNRSHVGLNDNFFELGGHSLMATQVVSRLRQATQLDIPLRSLFETPTVAGLARFLADQDNKFLTPLIKPSGRDKPIPLSFAQERMWFMNQLAPESPAYLIPLVVKISGSLDHSELQEALVKLTERHEILRTIFPVHDGQPVQHVQSESTHVLSYVKPITPSTNRLNAIILQIQQSLKRPLDIAKQPAWRTTLYQIDAETHILHLLFHHIIFDQWSMGIMADELFRLFAGQSLPQQPLQYADFTQWQRDWLKGEVLEEQLAYWRDQLAHVPILELPTDHPRPGVQTLHGQQIKRTIPPDLLTQLNTLSQDHNATLFMTLLTAFKLLMSRYTQNHDIAIGVPVANRHHLATESMLGTFVNTLVMRTKLESESDKPLTFLDLLQRVRQTALSAYAHQDLPFEKLVDELDLPRDLSHTPLVQVLFNMQNAPLQLQEPAGLTITPLILDRQAAQFDLSFTIITGQETIEPQVIAEFNTDLFEASTIERWLNHWETLLTAIIDAPDTPLHELQIMPMAEQKQLLMAWNETKMDYPAGQTLATLFQQQAQQTPHRPALTFGNTTYTYAQLDQLASQLATQLSQLGARPETRLAIHLPRSAIMVIALLATHKTGAAYLPLDPTYPVERLHYIIQDAKPLLILTVDSEEWLVDSFQFSVSNFQFSIAGAQGSGIGDQLTILHAPATSHQPPATSHQLAYTIYTSGSTGRPKGVDIEHKSVVNFLTAMRQTPGLSPDDKLLSVTTLSFDISVLEIFLPLTTGAHLHLVSQEVASDGRQLAQAITNSGATIMQATPTTWTMLLESGWRGSPDLRKILCGGEVLPRPVANQLLQHTDELWNMYGPTETTIWSAVHRVRPGDNPIPIGHPIANTQFYVLDPHHRPVPLGIPGELYIGGDGLARGYHNRPNLTAERFVNYELGIMNYEKDTPFIIHNSSFIPPNSSFTLYKTGDLVRYRPDGNLDFLGRTDFQVKVRGHRIELGEIETALTNHPAIRETVVTTRPTPNGDQQLVAYLIGDQGSGIGDQPPHLAPDTSHLAPHTLRTFLAQTLPPYMIPNAFVFLEQYPTTPNNKIDRQALPAPEFTRPERTLTPPRNNIEQVLVDILKGILNINDIGIHDNFFELGGHSLQATRYLARVNDALRENIPLREFLVAPTVASLSTYLLSRSGRANRLQRIAHLIVQTSHLSDEQVQQLLQSKQQA